MNSTTCSRCKIVKPIKAKGLCNACYTYECRHKKVENNQENEKLLELEMKVKELQDNLSKSREENYLLLKENVSLKESLTQISSNNISTLNSTSKEDLIKIASSKEISSLTNIESKDLSHCFIKEVKRKEYNYDIIKYKEYLNEIMKKKKWYGLGEDKLIEFFPCFKILISNYNKKIFGKRSKEERELIEEEVIEGKSMIETKGRIVTCSGQLFLLLQNITFPSDLPITLQDLFNIEKIKIYIQFMEDLKREPCSIRNLLLTLKFIIKSFKTYETFKDYQKNMIQTSDFLDIECSLKKGQNYNKWRPNSEDLFDFGHFINDDEFTLLIIYILEQIKIFINIKDKSLKETFKLQYLCFTIISLLDGGQRREVISRLQIDSLIQEQDSKYYIKKQTEKRNRGNSHEIPILEISAYLIQLWKKERKTLLEREESIISLWITKKLKPKRPNKMIEKMILILKEFNPCLQLHKMDLRRLRISSLFEKEQENISILDSNLVLAANYLNTSLDCIRNNYNRSKTDLTKGFNLLQPISKEMNQAFESFKTIISIEELEKETPKFKRYIRTTLNDEIHLKEFQEWKKRFEILRNENGSILSFEELYEQPSKKRKVRKLRKDSTSEIEEQKELDEEK